MPWQGGPSPSGGHAYKLVDLFRYLGCFRAEPPGLHAGRVLLAVAIGDFLSMSAAVAMRLIPAKSVGEGHYSP